MTALYIALGAVGGLILLLALSYLLIFVRPRAEKPADPALLCPYAHRGLHSEDTPENSLDAFAKACEAGFGIELDVQLSRDGEVMVFHDYTLIRMTGREGKLSDLSCAELRALPLKGSDQTVPTFREVLELVDGRVPLLVELKGEDLNAALCPKVAELLRSYKGAYCIESFNPLLIRAMRRELPRAYYGQLYTNVCRDKKKYSPLNLLLTAMAFNFLAKPDFIAYNYKDRKSLPVKLTTRMYKAAPFIWTARDGEVLREAAQYGEYPIFEHATPADISR